MIIKLSPTAYDVARAKQAAQTPAKLRREGQKALKGALGHTSIRGITAGNQYLHLLKARRICQEYGIEEPVIVKWFILLHKAALVGLLSDDEQISDANIQTLRPEKC